MSDTVTEKRRLAAVIRLGLLDTPPEGRPYDCQRHRQSFKEF